MRRLRAECARTLFGDSAPDLMMIGRFRLVSQVGTGGQGAVYVAEDPTLDREVALKRLAVAAGQRKEQLLREGQALARVSHPNVVTVHEVGEDETGHPFLVMELVDGVPLHEWLDGEPRDWKTVVDVLTPIGEGLAALHEAEVVHRDVKPHNIVITRGRRSKLVDLGIAIVQSGAPVSLAEDSTRAHGAPGTVGYMAPEHVRGTADARSDQFSFCVTLFEAIYGGRPPLSLTRPQSLESDQQATPPFGREVESAASGAIAATDAMPMRRRHVRGRSAPSVPRGMVQVLARGLQHDPSRRYGDMAELLRALAAVRSPRRRWPLVLLPGGVVAAGLSAMLMSSSASPGLCDDLHSARSLWGSEARESVRAEFLATGSTEAEPTFDAVDVMLEETTAALDLRLERVCAADESSAVRRSELASLHGDHDALRRIVDSLADIDADRDLSAVPVRLIGPLQRMRDEGPRDACEQTEALLAPTSQLQQVQALEHRAVAAAVGGQFDEALTSIAKALEQAQGDALAPLRARLRLVRGRLALEAQRLDLAREQLDAARSQAETLGCDGLGSEALALWAKAHALDLHGSTAEAGRASQVALEKVERMGIDGARRAEALNSRALVLQRNGEHERALELFGQAIAIRSEVEPAMPLAVAHAMLNSSTSEARLGRTDAAIETLRAAQKLWASALWAEHPTLYKVHANLSYRYLEKGDLEASERELSRALELAEAGMGPRSDRVARLHIAMVRVLDLQRKFEAALQHATVADEILIQRHGRDDMRRLGALEAIGVVHMDAGQFEQAVPVLERALALQVGSGEADEVSINIGRGQLAQAHVRRGDLRSADLLYQQAVPPFLADPALRTHPYFPEMSLGWGETLVKLGRDAEAIVALQPAVEQWTESGDNPERLAHARWWLAQASCSTEPEQALRGARDARDFFAGLDDEGYEPLLEEMATWIDRGC
ncbi:MAG: protein kinase [Myxococcota bacterium]